MARIRTIKPEFFTSEDIVSLSPMARLLYIALWCEADREGRLVWKPKTFKMRYFPCDSCNIDKLCAEILDIGLVVQYGDNYAFIPAFHAHQHINPRESASQLPKPDIDATVTRGSRVVHATVTHREVDAQVGREGKGRESNAPPEGVEQSVWQDYLRLRKTKKAPVSATVIAGVVSEADKVGMTLNEALQYQVIKGWQGFDSSWVTGKQGQSVNQFAGAI